MFNAARILVSMLVIGTAGCLLGGCGQTGSLYLPPATKSPKSELKPVPELKIEKTGPSVGE